MSRFIHSDLGVRSQGDVVEVTLRGSAANVMLVDANNFSAYRSGRNYRGVRVLAKQSPVHLAVPTYGHWHGVVDMDGLRGTTHASFRVLA